MSWRRIRGELSNIVGATMKSLVLTFLARPSFKSRSIAPNSCKIAIMQPIQYLVLLRQTSPSLLALYTRNVASKSKPTPLIRSSGMVRLDESRPDEQYITNLDVTSLRYRTDVQSLIFAAMVELFEADGVVIIWIVAYTFTVGVASIIEQYPSTCYSAGVLIRPVVDGTFFICARPRNVGPVSVIVEGF